MKKVIRKDNEFVRSTMIDYLNGNDSAKVILVETLYGKAKDKAHGTDHIYNVLSDARKIKGHPLTQAETLAIIFHDAGNEVDRKFHEILGAEYFMDIAKGIDFAEIGVVANAILEHRSSFKGDFSSPVSELISSADRGKPDSLAYTLKRSYTYASDRGENHEESIKHAFDHVKKKYSRNGTGRIPNMYKKYYGNDLNKFWNEIDRLTVDRARVLIEGYND